jgi:hypothetical protein
VEFLRPSDLFRNPPEEGRPAVPVKRFDGEFRFRGLNDREARGVCRLRLFERGGEAPVLVLTELPDNPSSSVTNTMEFLAPEAIRAFCPGRFEHEEPVVLLEHYPEERTPSGRIAHEETWDRVSFRSWAPRRVWYGGQERLSFGEPDWRRLPIEEVIGLIGEEEVRRPPQP